MNSMTTKIVAIMAVVVVVAAGAAVVIVNNNNNKTSSGNVLDMTWSEIEKDASGQTVNLGFYITQDPAINQAFWPYMQKELKDNYNITVTCGKYGPLAAADSAAEQKAGKTTGGTYDLIWGNTSAYKGIVDSSGAYSYVYQATNRDGKTWTQILPNSYYLKNGSEDAIKSQIQNYANGSAVNLSNGQTMMIYNQDYSAYTFTVGSNVIKVPYNAVLVLTAGTVTGVIKVGTMGAVFDGSDVASTSSVTDQASFDALFSGLTYYDINDVRSYYTSNGTVSMVGKIKYGLPTDFTELAAWLEIYPKQFTIPSYDSASGNFHTDLFTQAAIYELTWKNDGTGWTKAADRNANIAIVNGLLANTHNAEDYKKNFGYVLNYFNDIESKVHPVSSQEIWNTGAVTVTNALMVGNQADDKDFSDSTIMIATSTVTSIDARVDPGSGHSKVSQYNYNAGVFSLDTGCYSDYYVYIPANSSHVSAAMVIMNWLLSPETQFQWYTMTGNGFNIDVSKKMLDANGNQTETTVGQFFNDSTHRLYEYTLSLSADRLAEVSQPSKLTSISAIAISAWDACVRDSSDPLVKG